MGKKGEGEIKNLKKWVTSFMDGPTPSNFVGFFFFAFFEKLLEFRFLRSYFSTLVYQLIYHIFFTAELGDYEEETHTAAFVSEFRFIPHQDEKFELDVLDQYKKLR